jgi:hypothetical protein
MIEGLMQRLTSKGVPDATYAGLCRPQTRSFAQRGDLEFSPRLGTKRAPSELWRPQKRHASVQGLGLIKEIDLTGTGKTMKLMVTINPGAKARTGITKPKNRKSWT